MSRNGSGVYSPSATGYPAVASTTIESAKYNAVIADIATALTLSIAANGETTITANIPLAGYKITGLGNATADTDALNRVTADARYLLLAGGTMTGSLTVAAAYARIYTTIPRMIWTETDAATDEKSWEFRANSSTFSLIADNDSLTGVTTPISVARTGTTIDSINFVSTAIAVNTIDVTPTEGTFTAKLRATVGGADIATVTAKWKKVGNVVHLRIPNLTGTSTAATYYIQSLPAAIQAADSQFFAVAGYNNSQVQITAIVYASQDYIQLTTDTGGTFDSGSNTKGLLGTTLTYLVD